MVSINCPACFAVYEGRITSKFVTCEYCGTRYALEADELASVGFVDADGDGYDDSDLVPLEQLVGDDSSEPMDVFARDLCEHFLRGADESSFRSTKKIVRGLGIADSDEIYLIHDDTFLKSGKNGFAITREGLYCREMGEREAHFLSWKEFAAGEKPELDDCFISQDGLSVCYFTDDREVREEKLTRLYLKLYVHARKVM